MAAKKEKDPAKVKQGKQNRGKGYRGESIFRTTLNDNNIPTKRKAHAGIPGDIELLEKDSMEIKFRENLSALLWDWLENVKYVGLKRKYKDPLVLMRLTDFMELYKFKNGIDKDE